MCQVHSLASSGVARKEPLLASRDHAELVSYYELMVCQDQAVSHAQKNYMSMAKIAQQTQ